jgi:hypothetical protein
VATAGGSPSSPTSASSASSPPSSSSTSPSCRSSASAAAASSPSSSSSSSSSSYVSIHSHMQRVSTSSLTQMALPYDLESAFALIEDLRHKYSGEKRKVNFLRQQLQGETTKRQLVEDDENRKVAFHIFLRRDGYVCLFVLFVCLFSLSLLTDATHIHYTYRHVLSRLSICLSFTYSFSSSSSSSSFSC